MRKNQCKLKIFIHNYYEDGTEGDETHFISYYKKPTIFKGNHNTDFTIRLLTNFIPLISKKNAFLIHEGQLINNIIFVQEGRLSLEACIDTEEPYKSVKQYISKNFCDIFEDVVIVSDYESSIDASKLT